MHGLDLSGVVQTGSFRVDAQRRRAHPRGAEGVLRFGKSGVLDGEVDLGEADGASAGTLNDGRGSLAHFALVGGKRCQHFLLVLLGYLEKSSVRPSSSASASNSAGEILSSR